MDRLHNIICRNDCGGDLLPNLEVIETPAIAPSLASIVVNFKQYYHHYCSRPGGTPKGPYTSPVAVADLNALLSNSKISRFKTIKVLDDDDSNDDDFFTDSENTANPKTITLAKTHMSGNVFPVKRLFVEPKRSAEWCNSESSDCDDISTTQSVSESSSSYANAKEDRYGNNSMLNRLASSPVTHTGSKFLPSKSASTKLLPEENVNSSRKNVSNLFRLATRSRAVHETQMVVDASPTPSAAVACTEHPSETVEIA